MSTITLTAVATPMDWLTFPTAILPQWRQSLEFAGGTFGTLLGQNYFDGAANVLPTMPAMLDQFDPAIHANNESNRSTRKLVESNYTLQVSYAATVISAERNFRASIIAAIADYHLEAAMRLTPTGASGTFATPSLALHGIPAKDIIPAILQLALANGRGLIGSIITDL
jgi:hypothetical protein